MPTLASQDSTIGESATQAAWVDDPGPLLLAPAGRHSARIGGMNRFASYDGAQIGVRTLGLGRALVCLPGGPGRTCEYLGDLGGMASSRQLVLPDTRGTGASADAADPGSYRCDRLVADVEALHAHLGFERIDLAGHSAGANVAVLYAAAHPERIDHLILLTPGLRALGITVTDEQQRPALHRRSGEPWYPDALAAAQQAEAGDQSQQVRDRYLPFLYGRWDEAARAHATLGFSERARAVQAHFYSVDAFDPPATAAALARLDAPVLVYGGELDLIPADALAKAAAMFPNAEVTVQPGAGHYPWVDDPAWFSTAVNAFLGRARPSAAS
jgi:proline iminopeptidase